MSDGLDRTHDPALRSWVASANAPGGDFPIQNLPFGVFRRRPGGGPPCVGVAIGDGILDVAALVGYGLVSGDALSAARACENESLNELMGMGPDAARALRHALSDVLRVGGAGERHAAELLVPMADAELFVPARIGDYTDFYASIYHATNVGTMFRPDNPLLPNYKWVPIGYHGRASSIVASGSRRPPAQGPDARRCRAAAGVRPHAPHGLRAGAGHVRRRRQRAGRADADRPRPSEHMFGLCLVNDWSARDIQAWEYQPLGPFLAKNFATTVSPWVVTLDALAPFRAPAFARPAGDPAPLPYLRRRPTSARRLRHHARGVAQHAAHARRGHAAACR